MSDKVSLIIPNKKLDGEEEYFARQEVDKLRRQREEKAAVLESAERDRLRELHHMCCPKCGLQLEEIDFQGLLLDKCFHCGGIYFDAGELDTLISRESTTILKKIKSFFG